MTSNTSLNLNTIFVIAYGHNDELAKTFPAEERFDCRSDFDYGVDQKAVAVLMSFTNDRFFEGQNARGIRRRVSVNLVDEMRCFVISESSVLVNMPRGMMRKDVRVDLSLVYNDINMYSSYRVVVRDEVTKKILGEKKLSFFDRLSLGSAPSMWYKAIAGALLPEDDSTMYKQCLSPADTVCKLVFYVRDNMKEQPLVAPEVEVRITFDDGTVQAKFVRPVLDEVSNDVYHITSSFYVTDSNRGCAYAELICMDYPVAGFVFDTASDWSEGYYEGKFIETIEDYNIEAGLKRLRESLEENREEDESETHACELTHALDTDNLDAFFDGFSEGEESAEDSETEEETALEEVQQEEDQEQEEEEQETPRAIEESMPSNDFMSCISNFVGLKSVREKLSVYEKLVMFNKLRADNGLATPSLPLHAMFLGSPGTGKTTVAKRMGVMLRRAGVLSKGHVVIKERSNLLGPYYRNEATNTLQAIEDAQGGILFIDEAYQLYQPNDPRDPGKFVIETLLNALADESKRDWMLILAGYPVEMRQMFDMNPGLKSRIPASNIYVFDDFSEGELMEIAERYFARHNFTLSDGARAALSDRLAYDYKNRDKTFGNARYVMNLIQTEILPAMAVRVLSAAGDNMPSISEICATDIPAAITTVANNRRQLGFIA